MAAWRRRDGLAEASLAGRNNFSGWERSVLMNPRLPCPIHHVWPDNLTVIWLDGRYLATHRFHPCLQVTCNNCTLRY
jgi:hypothetical protein